MGFFKNVGKFAAGVKKDLDQRQERSLGHLERKTQRLEKRASLEHRRHIAQMKMEKARPKKTLSFGFEEKPSREWKMGP